tara:strand:- start:2149 stop:3015 length:867 start_codon:yes stop_codon:yes gene_type:complete
MFSVLGRLKKRVNARVSNILLFQSGYEDYCKELSNLQDIDVYVYDPKSWGISLESCPSNLLFIQQTEVPMIGCFDKIVCIGNADEMNMAKQLQERFGIDLICVHNSSEENYCPRPFTFNVREKVQSFPQSEVSMFPFLGRQDIITIPPIHKDIASVNKEDSVCVFEHVPPNIMQAFHSASKVENLLQFNTDNLASAKVFLDTVVGLTPHLIKALSFGCIPVLPYSVEAERLLGDKGYFYNGYDEISKLIQDAMSNTVSQYEIKDLASKCFTNKQDFINKWEYVLGRSS